MRILSTVLLLAACSTELPGRISVEGSGTDADVGSPDDAVCIQVDPLQVRLVDADEQVVRLTLPEDCPFEPHTEIAELTLDDPEGAFTLDDRIDGPLTLGGEAQEFVVTLQAQEPGVYEGQVTITAVGMGERQIAVQLYGER